ncbi:hypothetical protein LI208_09705 [Longicatena sp. 210702-DFI.1.36]|uniref:hypothetical protein n=1 Tax=Bacillota TaxID=1239 RepID=UPI001D096178|nr:MULTISPECIES: hypothetical protein [Longicatena]MCB6265546.1 hypothetical protein [Longicatena sp. 210702-DFI.1.160]MCB6316301.1 hypothetical protein [Longicatena sp. 210702-DFI.1.100]MCB6430090.1 hypothetical protein [Longicatena sp. 210702-DFI.1.36]MCB6432971.1 hypothetical protein [Longicatena sp. 210702-DFI.1.249]MCB6439738.1 hypothetical protein [Longicatena sp. 210702-DFI.1.255]
MIDCGYVTGSKEQAVELIVGIDTVYVHDDIQLLKKEDEQGNPVEVYQYHEVQYDKDEYIKAMSEKNSELENQLTDTQLALCDVYELIG